MRQTLCSTAHLFHHALIGFRVFFSLCRWPDRPSPAIRGPLVMRHADMAGRCDGLTHFTRSDGVFRILIHHKEKERC